VLQSVVLEMLSPSVCWSRTSWGFYISACRRSDGSYQPCLRIHVYVTVTNMQASGQSSGMKQPEIMKLLAGEWSQLPDQRKEDFKVPPPSQLIPRSPSNLDSTKFE
jgi:hypothetical protein